MITCIPINEWNRDTYEGQDAYAVLEELKRTARAQYPVRAFSMEDQDQVLIDLENPQFMPFATAHDPAIGQTELKCLIHLSNDPRVYGIISSLGASTNRAYQIVTLTADRQKSVSSAKELLSYRVERLPFYNPTDPDFTEARTLSIIPMSGKVDEFTLAYRGVGGAKVFAVERHSEAPMNLIDSHLWKSGLTQRHTVA